MNEEIKNYIDERIRMHNHSGHESAQVDIRSLFNVFETVDTAPTAPAQTIFDQIKIYVNGSTYRLYWYDSTAGTWHYVTASA